MDWNKTMHEELWLNIKHQKINVKPFSAVGYEFEKGLYVFVLILSSKQLGFKPNIKMGGEK